MMNNSKKIIIFILVFVLVFGSTMLCFHNVGLCAGNNQGEAFDNEHFPYFVSNTLFSDEVNLSIDKTVSDGPALSRIICVTIHEYGSGGAVFRVHWGRKDTVYSFTTRSPYGEVSVDGRRLDNLTFMRIESNYSNYFFDNTGAYLSESYYGYYNDRNIPIYNMDKTLNYKGVDFYESQVVWVNPEIVYSNQLGEVFINYLEPTPTLTLNGELFGHSSGIGNALQSGFDTALDNLTVDTSTNDLKWLQKIFNRLGLINNNIVSGFTELYNALGGLFSPFFSQVDTFTTNILQALESGFNDVIGALSYPFDLDLSFITEFFQWFSEPFDSSQLHLENIPFVSEIGSTSDLTSQFKSDIQNIDDLDTLSFTIPYNILTVQDHIVLDFSWYSAIKSKYLNILLAFLYFSFLFVFVRSIPGIITGSSASFERIDSYDK